MRVNSIIVNALKNSSPKGRAVAIIGVVVSIVALYAFVKTVATGNILSSVAENFSVALIMMGVLVVAYQFRALKAFLIQRQCGIELNYIDTAKILYGSIALNNLVPLRAGDLLRIGVLSQASRQGLKLPFISVLVERLFDLALLLCFLLVWFEPLRKAVVHLVGQWSLKGWLAAFADFVLGGRFAYLALGLCIVAVLVLSKILLRGKLLNWFLILLTGLAQWFLEILVLAFIGHWFVLVDQTFESSMTTTIMANLATIIPSAPGYIGTFQLIGALPTLLELGHVPVTIATYLIVLHGAIWLFSTAIGLLGIWSFVGDRFVNQGVTATDDV